MKCEQIIRCLEERIPLSLAEAWDNPGLQVGKKDREISRVYLAVDATDEVIRQCVQKEMDLLITHHPLLLSGIKKIQEEDLHGRKILSMIENRITHYAIHTNFDVAVMGTLCGQYLQMDSMTPLEQTGEDEEGNPLGIGCVGNLSQWMTAAECCSRIKDAFSLEYVKLFGDPQKKVRRAALCPGSGKSLIPDALGKQAEIYITGDIGHHDGIDALDQGLLIIDAGHYGLEHVFVFWMEQFLKEHFRELEILTEPIREPFRMI